jgi:TRAP-type C4-dicarboxylate transport system permease large subunit
VILLGLLLMLGAIALSSAVIWANQDVFEQPAGTFTLLGYSADLSVTQVFLAGLVIGALAFMGIVMIMSGAGRRARRRAVTRRQLREQESQLRDQESQLAALQREKAGATPIVTDARHRRAEEASRDENLASR